MWTQEHDMDMLWIHYELEYEYAPLELDQDSLPIQELNQEHKNQAKFT